MIGTTLRKMAMSAALAVTAIVSTAPAQARDGRYRDGGDDAAIAVGAGILGLAIGGAIASDGRRYDRYYDDGYRYPQRYYDGPRYRRYYYDRPRHYRRDWREYRHHDRYDGRRDWRRDRRGW